MNPAKPSGSPGVRCLALHCKPLIGSGRMDVSCLSCRQPPLGLCCRPSQQGPWTCQLAPSFNLEIYLVSPNIPSVAWVAQISGWDHVDHSRTQAEGWGATRTATCGALVTGVAVLEYWSYDMADISVYFQIGKLHLYPPPVDRTYNVESIYVHLHSINTKLRFWIFFLTRTDALNVNSDDFVRRQVYL